MTFLRFMLFSCHRKLMRKNNLQVEFKNLKSICLKIQNESNSQMKMCWWKISHDTCKIYGVPLSKTKTSIYLNKRFSYQTCDATKFRKKFTKTLRRNLEMNFKNLKEKWTKILERTSRKLFKKWSILTIKKQMVTLRKKLRKSDLTFWNFWREKFNSVFHTKSEWYLKSVWSNSWRMWTNISWNKRALKQ